MAHLLRSSPPLPSGPGPSRDATATPPVSQPASASEPSAEAVQAAIESYPSYGPTRDMDATYEKIEKIGEGTYGEVCARLVFCCAAAVPPRHFSPLELPHILLSPCCFRAALPPDSAPLPPNLTTTCRRRPRRQPPQKRPQVHLARRRGSREDVVALKKIKLMDDSDSRRGGFPITSVREIKILKVLDHANVVRLLDMVVTREDPENEGRDSVYMVFEYLDHDLDGLTARLGGRFSVPQIKCYVKQILEGLHYIHLQSILHRDLKLSNVLVSKHGHVKLADLGLARSYIADDEHPLTPTVVTLWYRPPELLLGETKYGPAVDMWSAGARTWRHRADTREGREREREEEGLLCVSIELHGFKGGWAVSAEVRSRRVHRH